MPNLLVGREVCSHGPAFRPARAAVAWLVVGAELVGKRGILRHRPAAAVLLALLARDAAAVRDLAVDGRGFARRARVGVVVDRVEAKAGEEALGPLEVVGEAPVVVAAHVGA